MEWRNSVPEFSMLGRSREFKACKDDRLISSHDPYSARTLLIIC